MRFTNKYVDSMLKKFLFGSVFFLIELKFIHSEMYRSQVLKNTDILGSTPSTPAKDNVTAFPSQSYPYLQTPPLIRTITLISTPWTSFASY